MICKNCGEYFAENVKFCPICGTQLGDGAASNDHNPTVQADDPFVVPKTGRPETPPYRNPQPPYRGGYQVPPNASQRYPQPAPQGTPQPAPQPPNGGKQTNKALIILICVLGSLMIIGAAVVFFVFTQMNNGSGDDSPEETTTAQTTTRAASDVTELTEPETKPETKPDSTVRVPNLSGLTSEKAMQYLTEVGLQPDLVLVESSTVQEDHVISQSPAADASVEKGSKVTINVAKAPAPEPTETKAPEPTVEASTLYVIASENVTLRDAATRTGRKLATVDRGEAVTYIDSAGEFYYVDYNGQKGYILAEFLSADKSKLNPGSGNSVLKSGDYLYCRASDFATLRSTTSRSASAFARISRDERVSYLGQSGEWFYVSYDGKTGYVLKDYFSPQADAPLNYGDS